MRRSILLIALVGLALQCDHRPPAPDHEKMSLSKLMGTGDDEGFEKALGPHHFRFPGDHGPHNRFENEWWYFTGNLTAAAGERFGFQFTIFRRALRAEQSQRSSDWGSNQIYMAHFAITDVSGKGFYYDERLSRDANGLAGAQAAPFKVWLEDWVVSQQDPATAFDLPVLSLRAATEDADAKLILRAVKPRVLQGQDGLSRKGNQPGDASYYYSYPRLATEGTIKVQGRKYSVRGSSWMDREWSTNALGKGLAGWDWFALQLDDNTELMYYQLRKKDGSPDDCSQGALTTDDGSKVTLARKDVALTVTDSWQSPEGAVYPSAWLLRAPQNGIDLAITPDVKNQLLDVSVTYWEGSVVIQGTKNGRRINGRGYVELTGY